MVLHYESDYRNWDDCMKATRRERPSPSPFFSLLSQEGKNSRNLPRRGIFNFRTQAVSALDF